jgi:uncharacterized protein YjbJ (UPF0337 family)
VFTRRGEDVRIQGTSEQLVGKIQERYGVTRDEARRQVESWTPSSPSREP